jgi:hypothetical protein
MATLPTSRLSRVSPGRMSAYRRGPPKPPANIVQALRTVRPRPHRPARPRYRVPRLPAALRVLAPIRDQAPAQRIKGDLSGLVIGPDYQQVLARCAVPARRVVVDAGVANVQAINDGITYRRTALDDPPAHLKKMGLRGLLGNLRRHGL